MMRPGISTAGKIEAEAGGVRARSDIYAHSLINSVALVHNASISWPTFFCINLHSNSF